MCWEDVSLGRNTRAMARVVTVTAGQLNQVAGQSSARRFIAFAVGSANTIVVMPGRAVSLTSGIQIDVDSGLYEFPVEHYGDLVRGNWVARAAATADLIVFESHVPLSRAEALADNG